VDGARRWPSPPPATTGWTAAPATTPSAHGFPLDPAPAAGGLAPFAGPLVGHIDRSRSVIQVTEGGAMPPIVSSFEIARPPEEVYSYVTDPSRSPQWQDDVVTVRIEGNRPASVGTRFTTTRRIGRVEQTSTQEITRLDPPRRWAARGVDGPFRPSAGITVEPLGD
jgi:hypothetical protein